MYYLLRYGYPGIIMTTHEFHHRDIAKKAFSIKSSLYENMFQKGLIPSYTCLLISKGVRNNEEANSTEHGSIKNQSN